MKLTLALFYGGLLAAFASAYLAVQKSAAPDDYEKRSAAEKEHILMNLMEETTGTTGEWPTTREFLRFALWENLNTTVESFFDFLPYRHGKRIHSIGGVCSARFDAFEGGHPFTGMFQGNPHVMLRLSLAVEPDANSCIPGIGVKLLRDGMPSANFVAMFSLDGQTGTGNYFANEFSNHVPPPNGTAVKVLAKKFSKTSSPPEMVGLSDISATTADGRNIEAMDQVFPFQIIMVPNPVLREKFKDAKPSDSLEDMLKQIPSGTKLYNLYAIDAPTSKERIPLGSLTTTSQIFYTKNGDDLLFFRHQKIEEDFALWPEWKTHAARGGQFGPKCPLSGVFGLLK